MEEEENKEVVNENVARRNKRIFWFLIALDIIALGVIIYEIIAIAIR